MAVCSRSQYGFTLIEIMVAVSIFALIAAMTMTNLIQVGKAGEQVSEAQQRLAEVQFAMAYLGRDLLQLTDRGIRDRFGDEQPQLKLAEESLAFTRGGWNNLLGQPRSDLQRVEYLLEDEKLVRRYWLQLDQGFEEDKIDQTLLSGVGELSARILTVGDQSYDQWPLDELGQTPERPVALEVTLELTGFGRIHRVFELNDAIL